MKNEPHKDLDYISSVVADTVYARACRELSEISKDVIRAMYHLNDEDMDFVLRRITKVRIELRN